MEKIYENQKLQNKSMSEELEWEKIHDNVLCSVYKSIYHKRKARSEGFSAEVKCFHCPRIQANFDKKLNHNAEGMKDRGSKGRKRVKQTEKEQNQKKNPQTEKLLR